MKDALSQIIVPLIPFGIILSISNIIHIRKFLEVNRKRMEIGEEIEFSNSKFHIEKTTFFIFFITIFFVLIYLIYAIIVLQNKIMLLGSIPLLIGGTVGILYRIFIKPSRIGLNYKKVGFVVAIIIASFLAVGVGKFGMSNLLYGISNPNTDGYKVLSSNDFPDEPMEETGDLMKKTSILIPKSYEYTSFDKRDRYVITEYADVLNENLAKNLVNRYLVQGRIRIEGHFRKVEDAFKEGIYNEELIEMGLTKEDFYNLKEKDMEESIKEAEKIIKERSIVKDKENLWNLDEAYFLNYQKDEIVIRDGKEVFYLEGKDFSDPEIIELVKDKLEL